MKKSRLCEIRLIVLIIAIVQPSWSMAAGDDTLSCQTEVVYFENFGSGESQPGPELPPGTTTYCYENLAGSCPSNPGVTPGSIDDGSYSIMNDPRSGLIFVPDDTVAWASIEDHTPGDTSGYMLVVNADFALGEFYRLDDIPLIPGETYAFSAWFANILSETSVQGCGAGQVPVNVNFVVEDAATGTELGSLSTGDIFSDGNPEWVQTEFTFIATSPTVNIVLVNNASGGCGNDFAIDDISLTGCIANTTEATDDLFSGCEITGVSGNVLDNDVDEQGDAQTVAALFIDLDGDLFPETPAALNFAHTVGGDADGTGATTDFGDVTVMENGSVLFEHTPEDIPGTAVIQYVVCDNGIPLACDTALAEFRITCETDTLECPTSVFFVEDFGSGETNPGPALPPGTTTYCYENLQGSCPVSGGVTPGSIDDGSYSIMNDPVTGLIGADGQLGAWLSIADHTTDDTSGYMLVVNADFATGEFYRLNDIDVFMGEPYSFSAWFANILADPSIVLCGPDQVPVNVSFQVENAANGNLLGSISTGDIFATGEEFWVQREFTFIAESDRINVVLVNNAPGGCGNDFAIDDIVLFGCVANTTDAVDDNPAALPCDTVLADLLANDFDREGHNQFFQSFRYDADGDGDAETTGMTGSPLAVAGVDLNGEAVTSAGTLIMDDEGVLTFVADERFEGKVFLTYIICDDGIPVICDTAEVVITVERCLNDCFIPEFISPNGDGLNDIFYIECAEFLPALRLLIYNRWGNQVFDSGPGYDNSWSGTYGRKAQMLPEGVYYYIVEFNDGSGHTQAGDLLILK
jgi:gliding motility-associated-like protein